MINSKKKLLKRNLKILYAYNTKIIRCCFIIDLDILIDQLRLPSLFTLTSPVSQFPPCWWPRSGGHKHFWNSAKGKWNRGLFLSEIYLCGLQSLPCIVEVLQPSQSRNVFQECAYQSSCCLTLHNDMKEQHQRLYFYKYIL